MFSDTENPVKEILKIRFHIYIFIKKVIASEKQDVFRSIILQKQPSGGFLRKRSSENMQQIYRRTLMLKFNFNKVASQKNVTLQNQEISPEKNFTQSSTEKHISHDTRASNSKRSGNKKSVIILRETMTKLLNGSEMAKKIQSNYKIYVKTFSGAAVSCMEDYIKPSLKNPPDHFILHVGTNDLSSEKCSMEIAESVINMACRLKNEIHDVSASTVILRTETKN